MIEREIVEGDWVNQVGVNGVTVPVQLTWSGIKAMHGPERKRFSWRPIPLTEEVIEANGWTVGNNILEEYGSPYDATMLHFSITRVVIGTPYTVVRVSIRHHETFVKDGGYGTFKIQYVHQLQRALRSCSLCELANKIIIKKKK